MHFRRIIAFLAVRHPLSRCYICFQSLTFPQSFLHNSFGLRFSMLFHNLFFFAVRHSVFAIINIIIFKLAHERLLLLKPALGIEVSNISLSQSQWSPMQSCWLHQSFLCQLFRDAVFRAGWRSPDEIKIANFIFSVLPFQDVKINVGIFQIQRDNAIPFIACNFSNTTCMFR